MNKSIYTHESAKLREELREARRQGGLSQREVAKLLDVSPSWVAKVETGERRIDLIEFGWFIAACGGDVAASLHRLSRLFPSRRAGKGGRPV